MTENDDALAAAQQRIAELEAERDELITVNNKRAEGVDRMSKAIGAYRDYFLFVQPYVVVPPPRKLEFIRLANRVIALAKGTP
jgi:hypothetical protein